MDTRVLILTVPSLAVLGLLIAHSRKTLTRGRAVIFWVGIVAYGIVRGLAVRAAMSSAHGSFPYAIRRPLFPVLGVSLQEVAGWAVVTYLAWWLGARLSRRIFVQVAWACVFLGAISWAVEAAAVAASWWRWSVPVTQPILIDVPTTAIVDWMFVGIDFLLPFLALTAASLARRPSRFLTLLAFPAHFAAHALAGANLPGTSIPIHHLAHWILVAIVLGLALRARAEDDAFPEDEPPLRALPLAGLAIVLLDVAGVDVFLARRPELLVTLLPAAGHALLTLVPAAGYVTAGAALVAAAWMPSSGLAVVPAAVAGFLRWGARRPFMPAVTAIVLATAAYTLHAASARGQAELAGRLTAALAERDRGDLESARRDLAALSRDFRGSHVPLVALGEIDYRAGRLEDARGDLQKAIAIKQDFARGYRYLTVIELRLGRPGSAARYAAEGLAIDAQDVELTYLQARAQGRDGAMAIEIKDPAEARNMASLAFEVGDGPGAALLLDRALARWPDERSFYSSRVKVALQAGDREAARRAARSWRDLFPDDAEARQVCAGLGLSP